MLILLKNIFKEKKKKAKKKEKKAKKCQEKKLNLNKTRKILK